MASVARGGPVFSYTHTSLSSLPPPLFLHGLAFITFSSSLVFGCRESSSQVIPQVSSEYNYRNIVFSEYYLFIYLFIYLYLFMRNRKQCILKLHWPLVAFLLF